MDEKKVREAIAWMENERRIHKYGTHISPSIPKEQISKIGECYDLAIEALEKQLPKKVIIKDWCPSYCPSCGYELSEDLGDGYYRHPTFIERCPNPDCGQKLDWSE
ncbi:hypothetical protein [Blautia sp.]|uniref:hypothetical protein n=1 Tax=Blautia sp. TaxID=1955243 RepID=UPI002E783FD9|nr:hypothetical protein [Blautia sp.]